MKYYNTLIFILFTLSIFAHSDSDSLSLTIDITNIKDYKGNMYTCLVADEESYLGNCENGKRTPVDSSQLIVTFQNIPLGTYCVTIFHDVDGDGRMRRKIFGLPAEPYGFSNNPKTTFGPPKYEKCSFLIKSDTVITVKL